MLEAKNRIRKEIISKLKGQPEEEKRIKSNIIKEKLLTSSWFKKARNIFFFVSTSDEVETRGMIKYAIETGKRVFCPRCVIETNELVFQEVKHLEKDLKIVSYGIHEPCKNIKDKGIPLEKIDLVIVPGIAFDEENNRLGRGKAYYDKLLKKLPKTARTIGICFDFQLLKTLPKQAHDLPVSEVISN